MSKGLTTEELLELVKKLPEEKKEKRLTPTVEKIRKFYKETGLKPGIYELPSHTIYDLYLKWETSPNPLHIIPFYKEFNKKFERKTTNFSKLYFVNLEPFGLTVEQHSKIIRELRDAENKKFQEGFKRTKEKKARKAKEAEIRASVEKEVAERLAKEEASKKGQVQVSRPDETSNKPDKT